MAEEKKRKKKGDKVGLDDKVDLESRFQSLDGTYELATMRQGSQCQTRSDILERNVHQIRNLIR